MVFSFWAMASHLDAPCTTVCQSVFVMSCTSHVRLNIVIRISTQGVVIIAVYCFLRRPFIHLKIPGVIFIAQGPAAVSGTTMSRWQRAETGERLASQPSTSSLRCISRLVHERHGGAGDVVTHTGGEFCFTRIFLRWSAQLGVSAPEEEHFWRFASRKKIVRVCM